MEYSVELSTAVTNGRLHMKLTAIKSVEVILRVRRVATLSRAKILFSPLSLWRAG
jgi:hypothetical protein